jgi:phosphatidylinositol alpha-1,6-mannosyltransferase
VTRVLVVTNDFPPRPGGIQSFVHGIVSRLPPSDIVVYTSRWRGWEEFDATQPYEIVRESTSVLLPTPSVRRRAVSLLQSRECSAVWFGAMAPLGLLAPALRRAGASRLVGTTHGHEVGWALLPGPRQLLRRIASGLDVVTYLGEYTRSRLAPALGPYASRMVQLAPGVDTSFFRPGVVEPDVRARYGLGSRPVVVCVSRLMPRKGQDTLIRALPVLMRSVPDVALLLVGGGPYRSRLEKLASSLGVADRVVFTGSVPYEELPAHYCAGDVFAMPCRTRLGGLDVEGLGIVFLEASACGLPVVAGRSGGAPDAVVDGETGYVVDGEFVEPAQAALRDLIVDEHRRRDAGKGGRAWVEERWRWESVADEFVTALRA